MRVIQKLGLPHGSRALLYRRTADSVIVQDANGKSIAEISSQSWSELIQAIAAAPKRWFVVTDESNPPVFEPEQVIYELAKKKLSRVGGGALPSAALPAIAPILMNEGTLSLYQGSVTHDRLPQSQSVARVYLWRAQA